MCADSSIYLTVEDIEDLYEKHLREIIAFVYGYVKNEEDALDLTQDIFFKLYSEVKNRQITYSNPRAYLYKTARNHCIDMLRKEKVRPVTGTDISQSIPSKDLPEEKIIDSLVLEAVFEYIENGFPETEKTVFKLRYLYGFNLEEISSIVGPSVSTISRILAKLGREVEDRFPHILDR
jgi:RNA polymerase sigma-70 factor (ECF subfamily)